MSKNILSQSYFPKTVIFQFVRKPSLDYTSKSYIDKHL